MNAEKITAHLFRRPGRPTWYMRFKLPGMSDYKRVCLHCRDKQVADAKRLDFIRQHEREAAGIIAPAPLRNAAARTVADHLADLIRDLDASGRSAKYCYDIERRITKLSAACEWTHLRDITAESFNAWRSLNPDKLAAKTLNEYLNAANVLLNRLTKQGKLIANPLASVDRTSTVGKQRRKRRAITPDQFAKLLEVAPRRRLAYLAAVLTGLRRNELRTLTWADVRLDAPRPFLLVRAENTKNRKPAPRWLRDDLAAELRTARDAAGNDQDARVFAKGVPDMDTFKRDLRAAGIDYVDASGRRFDFHSLRHTLATWLHVAGVPQRQAMSVMRHTDARLTDSVYADADMIGTVDAIERLPRFERETPAAIAVNGGVQFGATGGAQFVVRSGPLLSTTVTDAMNTPNGRPRKNQSENRDNGGILHEGHTAKIMPPVGIEPTRPVRVNGF